ncbi:MAG: glycosyltransferase family 4 protein [Lentisphaerae bacterium]|nr:glycosyltransferase family 4 protein [Lentisphaerota bacterium]
MSPPPRVCHLVLSLALGGLERLVVDWTNARNQRHPGSTAIACLDDPGALADQVEGSAVFCVGARRARFPADWQAVRALRKRWVGDSTDIVHSHNLAAHQYAALARWGTSLRHVHTEHGSNPHGAGWLNRCRLRVLARRTHALIAVSADTGRAMSAGWRVPLARVHIIPNGVAPYHPATADALARIRAALQLPEGGLVVGTVGRLAQVKGYDRLLAALPAVLARRPGVTCVFVGDGPERAALEAQGDRLGLRANVRFAGFQADARAFYALFDLYVAPSRSEGLPVALLEAMAAGCPVLVTDVGDQRAVLDDGRAGHMLSADEREWPDQILACLQGAGREEARRRAVLAQRRVREHYSLAQTLDAYENIYAGSCSPHPTSP